MKVTEDHSIPSASYSACVTGEGGGGERGGGERGEGRDQGKCAVNPHDCTCTRDLLQPTHTLQQCVGVALQCVACLLQKSHHYSFTLHPLLQRECTEQTQNTLGVYKVPLYRPKYSD